MDIRDVTRARLRRPAGLRAAGVGVAMTPAITLVPSQDLRAHLSDYLQRARQGERITITVHGRPVAVLGPYEPVVGLPCFSCGVPVVWWELADENRRLIEHTATCDQCGSAWRISGQVAGRPVVLEVV